MKDPKAIATSVKTHRISEENTEVSELMDDLAIWRKPITAPCVRMMKFICSVILDLESERSRNSHSTMETNRSNWWKYDLLCLDQRGKEELLQMSISKITDRSKIRKSAPIYCLHLCTTDIIQCITS